MDFVPDTSVIIDGRFTGFISKHNGSHVILAEALIAEIEHQANEGRSIGSAALQELKFLRDLHNKGKIFLDFYGKRPVNWQIERAKSGEIDELIRICAAENNATLVTGDVVQKEIAEIKGISVKYIEPPDLRSRNIEEFFSEDTSSVHLKPDMEPFVKRGQPGSVRLDKLDTKITRSELENLAANLVKRGKFEDESFVELDMHGATVMQIRNMRIVITRPPFSDDLEITAVRPITKLSISDYSINERLMERLVSGVHGILVAGAPGAGKSTFVQALAEFFSSMGKIVKTMEKPRDLELMREITQYASLEGSMEKTGDILLLVRTDYTVFDEMRITSDFLVYSDLRLAGVGMVGVVHATRAIDAMQRFIGRVELGLIPQVIDTILFISAGSVSSVLTTEYVVKVPSGMNQEDLARPVIVVRDFYDQKPLFEAYTFGEQVVVVPVETEDPVLAKAAEERTRDEISRFLGVNNVSVSMTGKNRAIVRVSEENIPRLIGKKGSTINELERRLNMKLEVEPDESQTSIRSRNKAEIEIKNRVIHIFVKSPNRNVKLYIDDLLVLQAKSSSKGVIRIKMISDTGQDLYRAIKSGKTIEYTITD
ncbi:MAG: PINc/VapC family ATPase [Candidatus Thermoplasmatota archaeon]|nr:PINc/VapC family ATPase [Candidatus Thermoplasmatota archaeon]